VVINALTDEDEFTRLLDYLDILPRGAVVPPRSLDDVVLHIRERAIKQLEKGRFIDSAYTTLLVAHLPKNTKIADRYFDCCIAIAD
jgi:hypothetical protein